MTLVRPIVTATAVAGTLALIATFLFAGLQGIGLLPVLRYIASGPFGDVAREAGTGWAWTGLAVHYAIVAVMVSAYVLASPRLPALVRHPVPAGLAYGFLLWVIMYWVVKPIRWPDAPLPGAAWEIGSALFSHCTLVGIPVAWIASRHFRQSLVEPAAT